MRKFTKYAVLLCFLSLILWFVAAVGVQEKFFALDPLHFFERDSRFLCIHIGHDIVIIVLVLTAAVSLFLELRRRNQSKNPGRLWFVIGVLILLWITGYLLLWFTVGAGFMCGGG